MIRPIPALVTVFVVMSTVPTSLIAQEIELKVSKIALFSSGVGYFEREAEINGSATAELEFRTAQINDILKSLVVQDFGGGTIRAVGYASHDPVDRALKSFGVDITGDRQRAPRRARDGQQDSVGDGPSDNQIRTTESNEAGRTIDIDVPIAVDVLG